MLGAPVKKRRLGSLRADSSFCEGLIMTQYLKNQMAKMMARYFVDIGPDQFSLGFFKGEAELSDLELRPEVLQQLLGLPVWLILRKATIASIRVC